MRFFIVFLSSVFFFCSTTFANIPPSEERTSFDLDYYFEKVTENTRLTSNEIDIFLATFPTQESIDQCSEDDIYKIKHIYLLIPRMIIRNRLESIRFKERLHEICSNEKFEFENKRKAKNSDDRDVSALVDRLDEISEFMEFLEKLGFLGRGDINTELEKDIQDLLYGDDDEYDDEEIE